MRTEAAHPPAIKSPSFSAPQNFFGFEMLVFF
jgi:hypothetical protein